MEIAFAMKQRIFFLHSEEHLKKRKSAMNITLKEIEYSVIKVMQLE